MQPKEEETPLGVLLISTFLILIGVWLFTYISFWSSNFLTLIFTTFGFVFIFTGWGVLLLKPWSYYVSIVICVLFCVILFPATPFFVSVIIYMSLRPHYFIENAKRKFNPHPENRGRVCPECSKSIPFDAKICPFCGKKFKDYL